MLVRSLGSRWIVYAILITLIVLFIPADVSALSRVRREVWSFQGDIPTAPNESIVDVSFVASVGDMDLPSRILFVLRYERLFATHEDHAHRTGVRRPPADRSVAIPAFTAPGDSRQI